MCGIAGVLNFERECEVTIETLRDMTDAIAHRGPDGEGFYCCRNVGLGHRRLAIIDLHTGDQPMYSEDRRQALVFNGEIYNYVELREELKQLGRRFRTDSDTEVILQAYGEWGTECQSRFIGMWAFALWDEELQRLFLSRDRMGEKPLYYACKKDSFLFASEIKSLFAAGMTRSFNWELLDIYLTLGYIPAPFTFFKDIHNLYPGHFLLIQNGKVTDCKYWDLPEVDEADMREDAGAIYEEFEFLLRDAVRIQMRSDVPFGAFLSGGLDSASIVALMSEQSRFPVETFTIGFEEKSFDERSLARDVSSAFKTNHHEYVVRPDSLRETLALVSGHYDEPFGDASAVPVSHVSRVAAEKVKMVLTGDGGDEVLSGYTACQGEKMVSQIGRMPDGLRKAISFGLGNVSPLFNGQVSNQMDRAKCIFDTAGWSFVDRLVSKSGCLQRNQLNRLIRRKGVYRVEDFVGDFFRERLFKDDFYNLMLFQLKVSLPNDMLTKVDRMSMAYSLETRAPFLDYRLVELMFAVSKNVKMKRLERKSVLRNTVARRLPGSLLNAPKKGFSVPLQRWFNEDLFGGQSLFLDLNEFESMGLDCDVLKNLLGQNGVGKNDYGRFLWMLLVLRQVCRSS